MKTDPRNTYPAIYVGPARAPVLALPFPDHRLSLNSRSTRKTRIMVALKAKDDAGWLAKRLYPEDRWPYYPHQRVMGIIYCERESARAQVWDVSGIIEACKPYADALNGIVYTDDAQIIGWIVQFDERPTKRGIIHLGFFEALSPERWPQPLGDYPE